MDVRKGQDPGPISREEFHRRFRHDFFDPAYDAESQALDRLEDIAWKAYEDGRKAPRTHKAGPGFQDPDYDLSDEWRTTRDALIAAEKTQKDAATTSRVLIVCAASRNDGTCPGEISKTFRLVQLAKEVVEQGGMQADVLDLSLLTSSYNLHIHPCKGCVSTAMPLCHWPCSCYPNHATRQTNDWMGAIYEQWVAAHGVILVTPTYWYTPSSPLKLMMDRLVCADGGNPDPTSTQGKKPELAKQLELDGWPYPKHLAGRAYGVVVHGDVAGIDSVRRSISDWLDWMGLVEAGSLARLERYIGYWEPYATSHQALDADTGVQEEVRNVARAVVHAVQEIRAGRMQRADDGLKPPRTK